MKVLGLQKKLGDKAEAEPKFRFYALYDRIYFMSNRNGREQVWTIPAGGGVATQVTFDIDFYPDWSPRGSWLAFQTGRSGNPDIWVIDVPLVPVEPTTWGAIKMAFD